MREEAKHKRIKGEARNSNYNTLDKTLAYNHQKYDSIMFGAIGKRTQSTILLGAPKRVRDEKFMNLRSQDDTFDRTIQPGDQLYSCKHITLSGTKYIAGRAVVAVKATHIGLKFGKLLEIIVVNRIEPFVKFRLYETESYDHSMGAYRAMPTVRTLWHKLTDLVDHRPLTVKALTDNRVTLLPDYNLTDAQNMWQLQH